MNLIWTLCINHGEFEMFKEWLVCLKNKMEIKREITGTRRKYAWNKAHKSQPCTKLVGFEFLRWGSEGFYF